MYLLVIVTQAENVFESSQIVLISEYADKSSTVGMQGKGL